MPEPILIQSKTSLPISEIAVRDRLRPAGDAGVAAMVSSIREIGQIASPVNVRQVRRGGEIRYELIDGAHRIAAALELEWTEVPVRVFECNDDQARIMEIDGNLAGAELTALDTAVFLATRKAVYERLHPETKATTGAALAARRWDAAEMSSVASFAAVTAEKFGMTERHVRNIVAAGARLDPSEIRQLRLAPRAVTLADLQEISKIGEAPERYEVVRLLATGEAKGAAAARKAYRHRENPPAHVAPVDQEYLAIKSAWVRARKEAKRRFVNDLYAELAALIAEDDQASDNRERESR